MTLTITTLFVSSLLLIPGIFLLIRPHQSADKVIGFLRSKKASFIVFGGAVIWYLFIISQLGLSDFGQYKHWFFIIFFALGIGAFYFIPDFLAVRGLAVLGLLLSRKVLDIAYLEPQLTRLFLVIFMYIIVLASLYLGTVPYKLRDFFHWLFNKNSRIRNTGIALTGYGTLLAIVALTY